MKGFFKKFEDAMAAVAFAEAGEFETAREILTENKSLNKKMKSLKHGIEITIDDLTSMAITFAEAGEHEKALEILREAEDRLDGIKKNFKKKVPAPSMS